MTKLTRSKKIFELTLLILAAGAIYPLVYLRQNFETTILEVYGIDQTQLANIYAILGWMFVAGYIPSGWLADRVPVKWLLVFSLSLTAAVGFYYASIPPKEMLLPIFLLWGVSTVLTFWSALLKTVHILADPEEEGRFFGALDGGRGLVEAILATIAVTIFSVVLGDSSDLEQTKVAFQAVVLMYCGVLVLIAVGLVFLMENHEKNAAEKSEAKKQGGFKNTVRAIGKVLALPEVWLMMLIIFCGYTLFWGHYYFSGYLDVNHDAGKKIAGFVTVAVLWMRPIGGFSGGFLADKFGRTNTLAVAMVFTSATLVALAVLPSGSPLPLIAGVAIVSGLAMYVIRGVYWSLLDDCRVPIPVAGIAIGVISFFGYLPDVVLPKISAEIYTAFGDDVAGANNLYFMVSAAIGLLGVVACVVFTRTVKTRLAREAREAVAATV